MYSNQQEVGLPLKIKDEGVTLLGNTNSIDFTGAGVTGSLDGMGGVEEEIPGGSIGQFLNLDQSTPQIVSGGTPSFWGEPSIILGKPPVLDESGFLGSLKFYNETNAFYATLSSGVSLANIDFYLPVNLPDSTYLLNMTSGGQIGFDTNTYITSSALTPYAKLDGTNQPFTGNLNISKADPEFRLTDTGDNNYSRIIRVSASNVLNRKNVIVKPGKSAIGGTITTFGNYTIHTFTGNGTFAVSGGLLNCDVLVVAGGGGGGGHTGGGGGAGGVVYSTSYTANGNISVSVGQGGNGGTGANGSNGSNSVFGTITAVGGGYGAINSATGGGGGSGGGGGGCSGAMGVQNQTPSQGNDGGNGAEQLTYGAGGGGGAGSVGANGNSSVGGGNGGSGADYSATFGTGFGVSGVVAGGGGGGRYLNGTNGSGGTGGGGNAPASNATANTGGGGGGQSDNGAAKAGNGGSGVVVVRYLTSQLAGATEETVIYSSQDGVLLGERGIQTYGDTQGRHVIEGSDVRFNIAGVEKMQLNANGFTNTLPTILSGGISGATTITGSSDTVQFKIIGNSTQTANLMDVFASDGTTARFHVLGDGKVGMGTTAPSARLHAISTTEQLRLGYDASNYLSATIASNNTVTLANAIAADININAGAGKTLVLTQPVYEDLNFDPTRSGGPVATRPDDVVINNVFHTEFTSANNQLCGSVAELPHEYKLSSDLSPHAHIFLKAGESSGTTGVTFTIYWELRQSTGITSGSTTLSATSAELASTAGGNKFDIFASAFSGAAELGSQLALTIARTGGNAGDVVVTTYGVHYQIDTMGSRTVSSK